MSRSAALAGAFGGLALFALLAAPSADPAFAASQEELRALRKDIEAGRSKQEALDAQARKLGEEIATLRRKLIKAAQEVQAHEASLTNLESKLAELESERSHLSTALRTRREQMVGTLSALVRMAQHPPEAILLSQGQPIDAVRGASLLRTALPQLQHRADTLRASVHDLAEVRTQIQTQLASLQSTKDSLAAERRNVQSLLEQKAAAQSKTEAEREQIARRVEALSSKAKTMQELMEQLYAARLEPPRPKPELTPEPAPAPQVAAPRPSAEKALPSGQVPSEPAPAEAPPTQTASLTPPTQPPASATGPIEIRPFPQSGPITEPVHGQIRTRYGESTDLGNTAKGITFATRSTAQVVAPYDGKIVFSGPFRGYGQILIIEHSGGYHTLLAGLGRIEATLGQWVLAGEPIGVMGDTNPDLYVELRREGRPVNPLRWLAAGNSKVRG